MASNLKWNIILVGESGVGKTSMCARYAKNTFPVKFSTTVVVERFPKQTRINGAEIDLQIWSTASQECFRSFLPQYFRIAQGCILVHDATSVTTFHKLSGWLSEFKIYNEKAPVIIVGNKSENPACEAVNRSTIKSFADQENMIFLECNAKTGENVDKVFESMIQMIWENTHPETVLKNANEENSSVHQKDEENQFFGDKKEIVEIRKPTLLNKKSSSVHQKSKGNDFSILQKYGELRKSVMLSKGSSVHQKSRENNSSVHQKSAKNQSSDHQIPRENKSSVHEKTDKPIQPIILNKENSSVNEKTNKFIMLIKENTLTFMEIATLGFIKYRKLPTLKTFCHPEPRQNATAVFRKIINCFMYCFALLLFICAVFCYDL